MRAALLDPPSVRPPAAAGKGAGTAWLRTDRSGGHAAMAGHGGHNGPVAGWPELGRAAYRRQAWADTVALLGRTDLHDANDMERLAVAAYLIGQDAQSAQA